MYLGGASHLQCLLIWDVWFKGRPLLTNNFIHWQLAAGRYPNMYLTFLRPFFALFPETWQRRTVLSSVRCRKPFTGQVHPGAVLMAQRLRPIGPGPGRTD